MTLESSTPVLCLASASPRRRELLWQIGVPHLVQPADLDERCAPQESPADYVARLALAKAKAVHAARQGITPALPVLGADTTVSIDGLILGKPADLAQLRDMLGRLSGREHEVWSAVARLTVREKPAFAVDARYGQLVTAAFSQRRKTLRNAVRQWLDVAAIESCGIDPAARPETLQPSEFAALAQLIPAR